MSPLATNTKSRRRTLIVLAPSCNFLAPKECCCGCEGRNSEIDSFTAVAGREYTEDPGGAIVLGHLSVFAGRSDIRDSVIACDGLIKGPVSGAAEMAQQVKAHDPEA